MSIDNRPVVDRILTTAELGLRDFVIRQYKQTFKGKRFLIELSDAIEVEPPLESEERARSDIESPGWLQAVIRRKDAFRTKIGGDFKVKDPEAKQGFNFVHALLTARNRYAHWSEKNSFTNEDVYSLADAATRLLKVIRARQPAEVTEEIQRQFGESLFGEPNQDLVVAPATETNATDPRKSNDGDGDIGAFSVEENGEPFANQLDLTDAKLPKLDWRGRNIKLAKLHNTDLSQGRFSGEDLSQMTFDRVNLWHAEMQKANLICSTLNAVDLRGADLKQADLRNAKLIRPKMDNALLAGAKLEGVTIERAEFSHWKLGQLRVTIQLSEIDLSRARFAEVDLSGVDMSKSILADVSFLHADIGWLADFGAWKKLAFAEETYKPKPSRLYRVNLEDSDLTRAIVAKVDLKESNLAKTTLTKAIMQGTKLNDANLKEATLFKTNLILADLTGADLRGADLTDAKLHGAKLDSVKLGLATKLPDGSYWHEDVDMAKFTVWPPSGD